jgi:hypothetical protein
MECFREINQPDCAKLFSTTKDIKQMSCAKVTHQHETQKILNETNKGKLFIQSMIPSANAIGTGFLIGSDAVDKTRRKSIITRLCNKPTR